jgi:hypothetical protein
MNPLYAMIDQGKKHDDYPNSKDYYIDNYLNNILGNNLNKNSKSFGYQGRGGIIVDADTEYVTNNFGFRCKDWYKAAEILTIGCSNTYGLGVPMNGSWPKILEKISNKNVHNLSQPGLSIQELVFQTFSYFKKFGNPETIVCLFPDPFRMIVPIKSGLIGVTNDIDNKPLDTVHLSIYTGKNISDRKKYLKIPYDYTDVLPMEFALFFSMKAIHMLEQYCFANNIKLIWSSWNFQVLDVFTQLENLPFNNFLHSNEFIVDTGIAENCHIEYKEIDNKYFYSGQDIEGGPEYAHCGVHKHLHIAEEFYKELSK